MKLGKITKQITPTLVKAGGAIAGSYVTKLIPFGNEKVKSGVVMLAGLFMAGGKGITAQLGEGMAIGGALKLAQNFGIGGGEFITGMEDEVFINGIDDLYTGGNIMGADFDTDTMYQ